MADVLRLIAESWRLEFPEWVVRFSSPSKLRSMARSFYKFLVTHEMAPGELQSGWQIVTSKYLKPSSQNHAIKLLRDNLGSPGSDPEVIDQLMRDLSNFEAIGQLANSYKLKMLNRRVSRKAVAAMDGCPSFDDWHVLTTNEHSTPVRIMFSNGSRGEALRVIDAFGCLRSLRARSALDGVSWVQCGSVEIAVGRRMTACYKIRAVFCSLPRASLLLGAGCGLLSRWPKPA